MMPDVGVVVTAALLGGLIAAPLANRLRPTPRSARATTIQRPSGRSSAEVCAPLLDAIARQVRSGSSLTTAVMDEVDSASPIAAALDRLHDGGSLAQALGSVAPSNADVALALQALSATAHLGGPIAATLDEAAAVLRERAAARAERRAHGSQARLSARVLTIVPVAFAVWSAAVSENTRDVYVTTVAGGVCAVIGFALNLIGWRWMQRIIGPT